MDLTPITIAIIAAGFSAGACLGWLLRGERRDRREVVRQQRLYEQLQAQETESARLRRQLAELQSRNEDATHQHHKQQRQIAISREALDEVATRYRKIKEAFDVARQRLSEGRHEQRNLRRQLKLLITRTQDARRTPTAITPVIESARPVPTPTLQSIRGIGPALAKTLQQLGIDSLQQIAELQPADIESLDRKLTFPGRIVRDRWIEQARELLGGAALDSPAEERCA